ncbi:MAG: polyprenyl synthetase family protein [Candidatus Nomurabacteria bacterium]
MNINDFKVEFDIIFENELKMLISDSNSRLKLHPSTDYLKYLLTIGSNGKRIRPYNTALTYSIYSGKNWHDIKNTLIGIELIHLMALIHDDIMDASDTRHGATSVHKYIEQDLDSKTNKETAKQISQSIAILLGDLVFSWAYKEFSKCNQTQESWNIIHLLTEEVIIGQMIDVYDPIDKSVTMINAENKMLLKTARYTFTHPLMLGAILAKGEIKDFSWITDFGDSVGLLFQMQDDIFDFTKDVVTLKKNPLGDMKNGVHTMISIYIDENATMEENETWAKWFGNKNINNQEEINLFLKHTGAFNFAENFIKQKESIALDAISKSNLKKEYLEKIINLLSIVTKRKY